GETVDPGGGDRRDGGHGAAPHPVRPGGRVRAGRPEPGTAGLVRRRDHRVPAGHGPLMAVNEFAVAVTDILTVFDNDQQMTEELLAADPDDLTAEGAALARIREIARDA